MIHELKAESGFFEDCVQGRKPFEVRQDDRPFGVGDFLALNEIDVLETVETQYLGSQPVETVKDWVYTGRCAMFYVSYVLRDKRFVKDGYCILGIRPARIGYNSSNMSVYMDDRVYGAMVYTATGEVEGDHGMG